MTAAPRRASSRGRVDPGVPATDHDDVRRVRQLTTRSIRQGRHRRRPDAALEVAVERPASGKGTRRSASRLSGVRRRAPRRRARPPASVNRTRPRELHPEQRRVLATRCKRLRRDGPALGPIEHDEVRLGALDEPDGPARRERGTEHARRPGRQRLDGAQRAAAGRRRPPPARRPSAVSRPLIPFAARPNSTALSTSLCGAWSVAIASAVPSAAAARHATASVGAAQRRVDAQRAVAYGGATRASSAHGSRDRRLGRRPPTPSAARPRPTRRSSPGGAA